ncbi:hypothetical protein AFLA_012244 [Aspergillus flavus NRRL3357]|nr:hypothetical protein AFLA_012244 [Aspergillus flavus NRRL3357]
MIVALEEDREDHFRKCQLTTLFFKLEVELSSPMGYRWMACGEVGLRFVVGLRRAALQRKVHYKCLNNHRNTNANGLEPTNLNTLESSCGVMVLFAETPDVMGCTSLPGEIYLLAASA